MIRPPPPDIWYAQLPMVYAAAGALVTDPAGRVLMVKPNYRDYWMILGGTLEADEPPHAGCAREVAEEIDLVLPVGRLRTSPTDCRLRSQRGRAPARSIFRTRCRPTMAEGGLPNLLPPRGL
ncbi:MAG TPA: NUDIX hydrolase [Micromonospora sp.]|nr:NUDIX hydrolase [Micromonospora sp.]